MVATGIGLNLLLGVAKLAGGIWGHSYALIADAAESLLDTLSSLLVWAGFRVAATARLHAEESVQPGHFVVQYPVGWRRPGWPFDA